MSCFLFFPLRFFLLELFYLFIPPLVHADEKNNERCVERDAHFYCFGSRDRENKASINELAHQVDDDDDCVRENV